MGAQSIIYSLPRVTTSVAVTVGQHAGGARQEWVSLECVIDVQEVEQVPEVHHGKLQVKVLSDVHEQRRG